MIALISSEIPIENKKNVKNFLEFDWSPDHFEMKSEYNHNTGSQNKFKRSDEKCNTKLFILFFNVMCV